MHTNIEANSLLTTSFLPMLHFLVNALSTYTDRLMFVFQISADSTVITEVMVVIMVPL